MKRTRQKNIRLTSEEEKLLRKKCFDLWITESEFFRSLVNDYMPNTNLNKEIMYDTNNNEYISSILKKNNPFLKSSSMNDYKEQINKNKVHLEEKLVNLKQLLLTIHF